MFDTALPESGFVGHECYISDVIATRAHRVVHHKGSAVHVTIRCKPM
jgi:hypothetical protein